MVTTLVICPGCGVKINSEETEQEKDFLASHACWNLYLELSYYTLMLQDGYFIHQLIVDAYAAQHYKENMKPITITFALVGLYLVNVKKVSGKTVQEVHIKLANKSKTWPLFALPITKSSITVKDVLEAPDDQKQETIKKWSQSVWNIWHHEENTIAALLQKYLG